LAPCSRAYASRIAAAGAAARATACSRAYASRIAAPHAAASGIAARPPRLLLSLAAPELLEPPFGGGFSLGRDRAGRDEVRRLDFTDGAARQAQRHHRDAAPDAERAYDAALARLHDQVRGAAVPSALVDGDLPGDLLVERHRPAGKRRRVDDRLNVVPLGPLPAQRPLGPSAHEVWFGRPEN
jgi:hypothetical protein